MPMCFLPAVAGSSSTNAIKLSVYFLLLTLALGMIVLGQPFNSFQRR
jgi:hypothetical protein